MHDRVLLVDDEPRLLDGLRRTLRGRYAVQTAEGGAAGLAALAASVEAGDPFAVVVSDMMMPGMNGAEFLARAREVVPDAVMMILSGQADLSSTISAVNNANLFRFLTKPCDPEDFSRALDAALRQYQLIRAERELLQETLGGAVDVLTEVLAMASPQASRRTARVREIVAVVATRLGLDDDWRLPLAAMLSHLGCIAVPGPLLEKLDAGTALSAVERQMVQAHPATGRALLEQIPRMGEVARWVGAQVADAQRIAAGGAFADLLADLEPQVSAEAAVAPATVVPAVSAYLSLVDAGDSPNDARRHLSSSGFSPRLVEAVAFAVEELAPKGVPRDVRAQELRAGMVLNADITTLAGIVLVRRGERVTQVIAERVDNFARSLGVTEPIKVLDQA